MSWQDELVEKTLEAAKELEGAPLAVHRMNVGKCMANLATIEQAVMHFSEGEKRLAQENPVWFDREVTALRNGREKLTMDGIIQLVLYWLALKKEMEDGAGAAAGN